MSLVIPSKIGDQLPASYEARDNLNKLMRADARGSKDQVATRLAVECFQEAQRLQPGYFDGVKSWIKSGAVYAAAGAATIGAIGLAGYGIYQVASKTDYGAHLIAGLCGTAWISSEFGYRPIEYCKALLAAAVRDSANRASQISMKKDEKTWEASEQEIQKCRAEIMKQLTFVYDDCSKLLQEKCDQNTNNSESRLELKQMADRLEKQIPTIEKLLSQFGLSKHEVEGILQRFKGKIRFVQNYACSLSPGKSYGKINAELLERFGRSKGSVAEIAVPYAIKERVLAAKQYRFGILDRCAGYGSALVAGAKTFTVSTVALGTIAAVWDMYQNGIRSTVEKIQNLGWPDHTDMKTMAGLTLVAGSSVYTVGKKSLEHHHKIIENATYVDDELSAASTDLQTIYDGVAIHLNALRGEPRFSMTAELKKQMPAIQAEIQKLKIVNDPAEILGGFQQAVR